MIKKILTVFVTVCGLSLLAGDLEIISATYGNGDNKVDVTEKVKAAVVEDTFICVTVSNNFAGSDPAKGKAKTMKVEYKVDGETKTAEVKEKKDFIVIAAIPVEGEGLKVIKAYYGAPGKWMDVKDIVTKALEDNKKLAVNNGTFKKDPAPGTAKKLIVIYSDKGKVGSVVKNERTFLEIEEFQKK
ncbi:MAG: hypothetical protein JXR78_18515 [Victivallales bacterium]|nr:hypothetical protein [Victivallales bacterium]